MNTVTYLTDIFGLPLNQNNQNQQYSYPFILLHCFKPELILNIIVQNDQCICKPVKEFIDNVLYNSQIDPHEFSTLGDIIIPTTTLSTKRITVLLANKIGLISKYPVNYVNVGDISDVHIWKPICSNNYMALGYVVSKDKPSINEIVTIKKDYVTDYNGQMLPNKYTNMNEFNLLTTQDSQRYTLARSALLNETNSVAISSKVNNKNISSNDSDSDDIPISHTIQGELKIGNKCLSIDNNNKIDQTSCDNSTGSKWYFYNDRIISDYNQSCLSMTDNDTVIGQPCKLSDKNQTWNIKNSKSVVVDNLQQIDDKFTTVKGKKVVLLESDDPWYINKTEQVEGLANSETTELNLVEYEAAAKYDPSFKIDVTSPDLGHGHSYVERNGAQYYDSCFRDDEKVETFDGKANTKTRLNFNSIICCLIFVVFIMLLVKYFYN